MRSTIKKLSHLKKARSANKTSPTFEKIQNTTKTYWRTFEKSALAQIKIISQMKKHAHIKKAQSANKIFSQIKKARSANQELFTAKKRCEAQLETY